MAAPKPTSTVLKLLKGNPGKRAINKNEPKRVAPVIKVPGHLDPIAKTVWKKSAKLLDELGVLSGTDLETFENYCETYARIRRLRKELKALGSTTYKTTTKDGDLLYRAYPQVAQLDSAERNFRSFASELGLSPSSRSKVKTESKPDEADPLSKYGL